MERTEVRKSKEEWQAEARGKSWAKRLKEMHQVVKDLEPLIDMAVAPKLAPRPLTGQAVSRKSHAARLNTAVSSTSTRMSADVGASRRVPRPATAVAQSSASQSRPSPAGTSRGGQGTDGPSPWDDAMSRPGGRTEAWTQSSDVPAKFQTWGHGAGWGSDVGEGAGQQVAKPGMDNDSGDASLYAVRSCVQSILLFTHNCIHIIATNTARFVQLQRDEAIGARPRTRRGRDMFTVRLFITPCVLQISGLVEPSD